MTDLLIDVGQTSTRARLAEDNGRTADVEDLPGFVSGSDPRAAIEALVGACAERLGVQVVDRVAVGASGLFGVAPDVETLGRGLQRRWGTTVLRIADDGVTAFLAALDGRPGAMVAAGTGIVALALGPAGAARADGVGAMLGDDGSGWWIGRSGLVAAMSAVDGRSGGSRVLLDAAVRRYGPVGVLPTVIAASGTPIATTAAFAVDVARAASAGDSVAVRIWQEAAGHVANALTAVAVRAGLPVDLEWCIVGRVALGRDLLEPVLSQQVRARFPGAREVTPVAGAVDGVRTLLELDEVGAFAPMVAEYRS